MAWLVRILDGMRPAQHLVRLMPLIAGLSCLGPFTANAANVELEALGQALEDSAIEVRSLLGDASRRYLGLADRSDDWLVAHRDEVKALGVVVETADEIATGSEAFAAFIQSDEPKLLVAQDRRDQAIAHYHRTARDFEQTTAAISPLVSDAAADPSALTASADRYRADADRLMAAIQDLGQLLAYRLRGVKPGGTTEETIRFHLRQFFEGERGPDLDYGLVTHVLLLEDNGGPRNQAFVASLDSSTRQIELSSDDEAALINLFAIPVLDRVQARMEAEAGASQGGITDPSIYDYDSAEMLLLNVCLSGAISLPDFCAGRSGHGPFLLTHERWLIGDEPVTAPLLVVDLSEVHQDAFGAFIRAVKEQVMLPEFNSGERLNTLRLRLLTIILDAAYELDPIKTSIAEIVSLGGKR